MTAQHLRLKRFRVSLRLLLVFWLFAGNVSTADTFDTVAKDLRPFLRQHCSDCHTGSDPEANFDLADLLAGLNRNNFHAWVHAFDRVAAGDMPPPDSAEPEREQVEKFLADAGNWLRDFEIDRFETRGRVNARRLSNLQLERSLHAVLGIDIPLASLLPDETRTDGFTTVATGQSISHFQLEQHLDLVDLALDEAFRRALDSPSTLSKHFTATQVARTNPKRRCREPEMIDELAVVWASNLIFYGRLPATTAKEDGWYRFRIKASALNVPDDGGTWCTVRSGRCISSAPLLGWVGAFEAGENPQEWTFDAWLPQGHMLEVRPGDKTRKQAKFKGGQVGAGEGGPQNVTGVAIHSVSMEQIHYGPDDDGIRRLLFADIPLVQNPKNSKPELQAEDPELAADKLMVMFASRAFRRPVSAEDIAGYIDLVHADLAAKMPLVDAIRGGYRALLCSPAFMYFQETPGQLDGYAIASRLSYFLTGGPPDAELLADATGDSLRDEKVLSKHVERLLDEAGSRQFVMDFTHQWLDLVDIEFTEPDRKLYRGFDVIVQQSMVDETVAFVEDMLRNDRSARLVIDSEHTFLNSRLAQYYGVDGVSGDSMQRVVLQPSHHRGGLITHGSILKITANGTTTSPVIRGVWLSERLLGREIPPPPESVPAIEPDIRGASTIREMLDKHRSNSACASCHTKIDPPGFALEHYDPAGLYREHYPRLVGGAVKRGAAVDASYKMPSGESFQDLSGFRRLVLENPEALAGNLARHLVTYGTGAPVQFADRSELRRVVDATRDRDFGFRSLVHAVVHSDLFLSK